MCNEDEGRFSSIGNKMSAEHQLRVHFFSIFFIVELIYKESEGNWMATFSLRTDSLKMDGELYALSRKICFHEGGSNQFITRNHF